MAYMKDTKRKDLVKYTAATRPVSFRIDARYAGTGLDCRNALRQLFTNLVKTLKKEQFDEFKKDYFIQIDNVNKILSLDIMKSD